MGLFNKMQLEKINAAAKKSQQLAEPKKSVSRKTMNSELNQISESVKEYFKDSKAELITTEKQLHDYITQMIKAGIGGIDTETTGLDRQKDRIVGVCLYYPGGVEVYIPSKHIVPLFDEPYKNQLEYEKIGHELQRLVEAKTKLVFANADFDLSFIYKDLKVDLIDNCFYDVIIAWRCLKENERDNSLKGLYNKYPLKGKGDPMKFKDFFSPELFPYCKPDVAKLYAANDAKITYELFLWQLPYLRKDNPKCKKHKFEAIADLVWGVEFPMIGICQRMHRRGIYLEQSVADMLKRKYLPQCDEEHKKLRHMVQELMESPKHSATAKPPFSSASEFNPNSVPHVKWLCYDLLKLDGGKKGGTGKEILETFNLPVTKQILKCRSLVTLIGTFVEKLPNNVSEDSRIHCQFKQMGADCVVGDTIIATNKGYRKLSEICKPAEKSIGNHIDVGGIKVWNCNQELEDVQSVITFKQYPTIKITTQYGFSIEGTYNHPVMISKYTQADYLRNRSNKVIRTFWEGRFFKQLCDINVGDIIEIPCNYQCNGEYQPTNFENIDTINAKKNIVCPDTYTEEFAEFLGMYHADGTSRYKDGTYEIAIHNDDTDVISNVDRLAEKLFHSKTSHYKDKRPKHGASTYIHGKQLSCMDNVLTHGALNKKIPDAIWISPVSVINSYIKGMTLDSTVARRKSGAVTFEITVMDMVDSRLIQMHLASQGILCSIQNKLNPKTGNHFQRLKFGPYAYDKFKETIGFIESKKYVKDSYPNSKNRSRTKRIDNSFFVAVKKIEYGTNDVYDLHIPGTHSFISNGIISHNTGRMSSASPNMQNIPSRANDIRHMFRATPGYVLLSSDYS
ncbi:MAG: DNA polymerase [Clostridium sp.]|nr:DNA polymerase [Clostridium sp.]